MLLRFDSHESLKNWIESSTRLALVERARPWLASVEESEIETGLEFWFTPPSVAPLRAKSFKQFLITLSAIYPLAQIVPWLLQPLHKTPGFDQPALFSLLVVTVIVYLMVYLVHWLFH